YEDVVHTYAGGGPDQIPALSANLPMPTEVAKDSAGNIYIAAPGGNRVFAVDGSGKIRVVAGSGVEAFNGNDGPTKNASLNIGLNNLPNGIAVDAKGNIFFVDKFNNQIRSVDTTTGIIATFAGSGPGGYYSGGYSGDGGPATSARLNLPGEIALDTNGNLFIADLQNDRVRRVDASTGIITTFAGSGQSGVSGDGGLATSVDISPVGVAIESSGNLLIADADSKRVRRVNLSTNIVATVAGNGEFCFYGDGGTALAASLCAPQGLTADPSGNLLAYDTNNGRIRRINAATGDITTVAGGGNPADGLGDDAPATQATFRGSGLAADARGNMFITDWSNFRVRRVDAATGIITTVAGSGGRGGNSGDGGPATLATLAQPQGVVLDRPANLFISTGALIRRVDAGTGLITTYAGAGSASGGFTPYCGDGGPAINACLFYPRGLAMDATGNLFIADSNNNRIRRVDAATQIITTVAGNGVPAYAGDGLQAVVASLNNPSWVSVDAAGNLFIGDVGNFRVRRVDAATGVITTLAGNGVQAFSGDGGPASNASLGSPAGMYCARDGRIFISDTGSNRIRVIARRAP